VKNVIFSGAGKSDILSELLMIALKNDTILLYVSR
jgi:hypothetical protein